MSDQFEEDVRNAPPPQKVWIPEEGDYVVGIYYGEVKLRTSKGPGITLRVEDEVTKDTKLVWKTDVLRKEFEEKKIRVGERVGIKYQGKPGKAHLWSVFVDRPEKKEDSSLPF